MGFSRIQQSRGGRSHARGKLSPSDQEFLNRALAAKRQAEQSKPLAHRQSRFFQPAPLRHGRTPRPEHIKVELPLGDSIFGERRTGVIETCRGQFRLLLWEAGLLHYTKRFSLQSAAEEFARIYDWKHRFR